MKKFQLCGKGQGRIRFSRPPFYKVKLIESKLQTGVSLDVALLDFIKQQNKIYKAS